MCNLSSITIRVERLFSKEDKDFGADTATLGQHSFLMELWHVFPLVILDVIPYDFRTCVMNFTILVTGCDPSDHKDVFLSHGADTVVLLSISGHLSLKFPLHLA